MTAPVEPRVAVVVLNWRRPDDTLACIRSVAALEHGLLDIIICDNDSGDGSFERIAAGLRTDIDAINGDRAHRGLPAFTFAVLETSTSAGRMGEDTAPRLLLVPTGRNGGYAFGNNVGIRIAQRDPATAFVWILNNDTVVDPGALRPLIVKMAAEPDVGLCGCQVLYLGQRDSVQALGGGRFLPLRARCEQIGMGLARDRLPSAASVEAQLDYVNGAAAFARRETLDRAGLMDEGYFLYWEEIDWAAQIRAAGYRLGYCENAIVYHEVGGTTGADDGGAASPMFVYYMTKNRFRFLLRKRPIGLLIAMPMVARDVLRLLLQRRWTLVRATLRGAFAMAVPR